MKRTLIKNAIIVNEGKRYKGSVVIEDEMISRILNKPKPPEQMYDYIIDATGCLLLPGVIDEHVHFREPGLTHKADMFSESRAAVAGGVTAIMDMPNTNPPTVTLKALEQKLELLNQHCIVNHSCYFGATNDNYTLFRELDKTKVCGIKLFMGSSTGNMLVDRLESLEKIFGSTDLLIAAHCEDQTMIRRNTERIRQAYPENEEIPIALHSRIRTAEACYNSTQLALSLACKMNSRLHVLHLSTNTELQLFNKRLPAWHQQITVEVCVPHLFFCSHDYDRLGARIKCNPAIKQSHHRTALRRAVDKGLIDTIATDHAPHLLSEKKGGALKAASGMPIIQYSLVGMLKLSDKGYFTIETVVEKMCHAPARIFHIDRRGFIRPDYYADLVLVRPCPQWTVTPDHVLSKCGWSPLEGASFGWKVEKTIVNGQLVYDNGYIDDNYRGKELRFK